MPAPHALALAVDEADGDGRERGAPEDEQHRLRIFVDADELAVDRRQCATRSEALSASIFATRYSAMRARTPATKIVGAAASPPGRAIHCRSGESST